jgi:uncharacterized membrane protein (UPF0127 family)
MELKQQSNMLQTIKSMSKIKIAILIILLISLFSGFYIFSSYYNNLITKPSQISSSEGILISVEIARSLDEIERGLMYRNELCDKCGMLFVFPVSRQQSFWMKNTKISLDIIFIDENGIILNIAKNTTPFSTDSILSKGPAKYVLEVNSGFSEKNNLNEGSTIDVNKYLKANKPFVWVNSNIN